MGCAIRSNRYAKFRSTPPCGGEADMIEKLKKRVVKCIELRDRYLENAATGADALNDIYFDKRASS